LEIRGAVHDANQMLAVVLGRAELLLRSAEDASWRASVETIADAARDAAAILRPLLVSGAAAGAGVSGPETCNLAAAARAAWSVATSHPRSGPEAATRLRFVCDVRDDLVAAVDPLAARQILTNLVLNACSAQPDYGEVRIGGRLHAGRVVLEISDAGPGVLPSRRDELFDPVRRSEREPGRGLGLPQARRLARRAGGDLTYVARAGAPDHFRLELPAGAATAPTGSEAAVEPAAAGGAATDIEPLDVLVVEDETRVRATICELLESDGHRPVGVRDGGSARDRLASQRFAAAVIDYSLPGADGVSVARDLKRLSPRLVTILVSGWGHESLGAAADPTAVDLAASKPLDLVRLQALMAEAARLGRARGGAAGASG
jgi:CheY-like chemotaxis protein